MGTNNTVKMGDPELGNVFIPQVLSIPVGTTVHWVNADEEPHTVTSNPRTLHCNPTSTENFDSGPVDPDGTLIIPLTRKAVLTIIVNFTPNAVMVPPVV
jgi:plastocyanin